MYQTLFTFKSPLSTKETMELIKSTALSVKGKIHKIENGYIKIGLKMKGPLFSVMNFEFYISLNEPVEIRVVSKNKLGFFCSTLNNHNLILKKDFEDKVWETFVEELLSQNPDYDFALSTGEPIVEAVIYSDNEVQQIFITNTKNKASYSKALIGGLLFGSTGTVIGAMGGKSKSITKSLSRAAKKVYLKVRMSNGRIKEGLISVNSKAYNQIMVNMQKL